MNKFCVNCGKELLPNADVCLGCGALTATGEPLKKSSSTSFNSNPNTKTKEILPIDNTGRNYFTGILGGIIGGLIASLPWILIEIYANIIWSLLAALIAIGVAYGYKTLKGKVAKGYPLIIVVISFTIVLFNELVTLPLLLLNSEYGYPIFSMNTLRFYFQNVDYSKLLMGLVIPIIFTVLGIVNVIKKEKLLVAVTKEKENTIN